MYGAVQRPLFQDMQTIREELEPTGSTESDGRPRAEEPAAWKLNSWASITDQSVSFEAAACSRKA